MLCQLESPGKLATHVDMYLSLGITDAARHLIDAVPVLSVAYGI